MPKTTAVPSKSSSFDWSQPWDECCDWIEANGGSVGRWISLNVLRRLSVNAPVLLGFCTLCTVIHIVQVLFWENCGRVLGVHDTWRFSFLQLTSLFTHVLAHVDYRHLKGNMMNLLLVGPSVEHEFGSRNLLRIIVVVALSSAFAHIVVGQGFTHQLGASGVVFACILLNSLVSAENGKIPLSFVITCVIYLGDELILFVRKTDSTSHHAHLVGGAVGAAAGFYIHRQRVQEMTRRVIGHWSKKNR